MEEPGNTNNQLGFLPGKWNSAFLNWVHGQASMKDMYRLYLYSTISAIVHYDQSNRAGTLLYHVYSRLFPIKAEVKAIQQEYY